MGIEDFARQVKEASIKLAALSGDQKNRALAQIARSLSDREAEIIKANREDLERSQRENLPEPLLKRLKFDQPKIADVIDGINSLIQLEDPVGKTLLSTGLDEDLELYKVTCPIGVIGVIFESRPDALVQISTLCLKSGNCVMLKGGSEAMETNRILADVIIRATEEAGVPANWLKLMETRAEVGEMLKMDQYIDLIIPRGSNEFVRYIMDNSRIPVLGHADGICHCYVDESADLEMAARIVVDSKTQYVAVCNATETLLVHEKAAPDFLPVLKDLLDKNRLAGSGCPRTREIIAADPATEDDWGTEYLDYMLSIKVVGDVRRSYQPYQSFRLRPHRQHHYKQQGQRCPVHSPGWLRQRFRCSTRFSDGFRYGFGRSEDQHK